MLRCLDDALKRSVSENQTPFNSNENRHQGKRGYTKLPQPIDHKQYSKRMVLWRWVQSYSNTTGAEWDQRRNWGAFERFLKQQHTPDYTRETLRAVQDAYIQWKNQAQTRQRIHSSAVRIKNNFSASTAFPKENFTWIHDDAFWQLYWRISLIHLLVTLSQLLYGSSFTLTAGTGLSPRTTNHQKKLFNRSSSWTQRSSHSESPLSLIERSLKTQYKHLKSLYRIYIVQTDSSFDDLHLVSTRGHEKNQSWDSSICICERINYYVWWSHKILQQLHTSLRVRDILRMQTIPDTDVNDEKEDSNNHVLQSLHCTELSLYDQTLADIQQIGEVMHRLFSCCNKLHEDADMIATKMIYDSGFWSTKHMRMSHGDSLLFGQAYWRALISQTGPYSSMLNYSPCLHLLPVTLAYQSMAHVYAVEHLLQRVADFLRDMFNDADTLVHPPSSAT